MLKKYHIINFENTMKSICRPYTGLIGSQLGNDRWAGQILWHWGRVNCMWLGLIDLKLKRMKAISSEV